MPNPGARVDVRNILFVCLGNICRSPLAEGVFRHLAQEAGRSERYRVDSAGTGGWHAGESPDPRSVEVAARHGIELDGEARQLHPEDFLTFDLIVAMDRDNLRNIEAVRPSGADRPALALLREFDPETAGDLEVPDPYYGGPNGFDHVYAMVHRSCELLLARLEGEGLG